MNPEQLFKAQLILGFRKMVDGMEKDSELQEKRKKFLDWFGIWNYDLQVLEMYPTKEDVIKSKKQFPQYFHEYKYCNNRVKVSSETRWETDKLDFEKAVAVICEICLSLMRKNIHFCVFYAEGQRSPHIIIYDFHELSDLTPFEREMAQIQFWRSVSPFSLQWMDRGILSENHFVPLEFAVHWKHGTPFDLLFEFVPEYKFIKSRLDKRQIEEKEIIKSFSEETKEKKHSRYIQSFKEGEISREKIIEGKNKSFSKIQIIIENTEEVLDRCKN